MDRFLLGSARRLHRVRNQSPGFRAATFARGFSIPVAILDAVAFFRIEGVNLDREGDRRHPPCSGRLPPSQAHENLIALREGH